MATGPLPRSTGRSRTRRARLRPVGPDKGLSPKIIGYKIDKILGRENNRSQFERRGDYEALVKEGRPYRNDAMLQVVVRLVLEEAGGVRRRWGVLSLDLLFFG